jgi:hypothetical protein
LSLPASYYRELADRYRTRRDHLIPALEKAGFRCYRPRGAYYVMTDISGFGFASDVEFATSPGQEFGIAACRDRVSTSIRKTDPNRYVSPSAKSLRHWTKQRASIGEAASIASSSFHHGVTETRRKAKASLNLVEFAFEQR